jgi:hypothetical protein
MRHLDNCRFLCYRILTMKFVSRKRTIKTLKWVAAYLSILLVVSAGYQGYRYWQESKTAIASIEQETALQATDSTKVKAAATLPGSYNLSVPYAPQAPFSNWTVHEESCEEAATYMYRAYLESLTYPNNRIPDAEADTVYRAMKQWEVTNYGSEPDLTMTALGNFARSYYGYTPTVKKNITQNDIEEAIFGGHPVVVPVMTHSLGNNMYGPVSVYHVLLIKGYDATGVITNDAGVGNGVNHHYDWAILWQAIDAQTAKMNQGRDMLYLTK